MDTLYICSEPGCTHTHRRKTGGIYPANVPANVPVHHGKIMKQQEVPGDWVQITDTINHRVAVSSGGVLIIPLEAIEHEEEERAKDPEAFVGYGECQQLSLEDAIRLYEILGEHITQMKRESPFVGAYHERAAQALLEAFAPEAEKLCKQGKYWWPEVRREAYLHLTQLMVAKSNEVINNWRTQAIDNDGYPRDQQEEELLRHFAVLYYQKYPKPIKEDGDEEEEETTNEE
jgi:hypothetical protein